MLQISGNLAFDTIEKNLSGVSRDPDQKIIWPLKVRGAALGGAAAFVQVLTTWAALSRRRILHLPVHSLDDTQIDDFVRELHGLAASLLCDSALDVSGVEYHGKLQGFAMLKLMQLNGRYPLEVLHRKHDLVLLCCDHLNRGTPRLLYAQDRDGTFTVRNEAEFRKLASWIVRKAVSSEYVDAAESFDHDAIGSMLHELFENTEEHATTDLEGNILPKSLRGIHARHHSFSERQVDELTRSYRALGEFCHSIPSPGKGRFKHLMEISVFDSGPGLAQRLGKESLSRLGIGKEFELVQACFTEGVTTKARSDRGIGLNYVVGLLREKRGFLRIRTGRLSLFADLSIADRSSASGVIPLRDAGGGEVRPLRQAQGTLISLLIPLMRT